VSVDSKSKAKGFLTMLKSRDIVSFLLFMVDILSPLKYLSLMLQEEKSVLANQHQAIECTLESVKKLRLGYCTLIFFGFTKMTRELKSNFLPFCGLI
jgi:hypothetical protein